MRATHVVYLALVMLASAKLAVASETTGRPIRAAHAMPGARTWWAGPIAVAPRPIGRAPVVKAPYRILDLGVPAGPGFSGGPGPLAFDNAGKIVGQAYRSASATNPQKLDCIMWNGAHFVDLSPRSEQLDCEPDSINEPDAGGAVDVVGRLGNVPVALFERVSYIGEVRKRIAGHAPSQFLGVNDSGVAIGFERYDPPGGFFFDEPPITYDGTVVHLLQPYCRTPNERLCLEPAISNVCGTPGSLCNRPTNCGFGACMVNDAGTVVGSEGDVGEIFTIGNPFSATQEEFISFGGSPAFWMYGINNAGQVAYFEFGSEASVGLLYNVYTNKYGGLSPPPGGSCSSFCDYWPISQNNRNDVVGYDEAAGFFLNTAGGNQEFLLDDLVPKNSYAAIDAIGIDDRDRILVQLLTAARDVHWGVLVPKNGTPFSAR